MTDKAYFNIKQTKRSNPEARTTLDNLHQIQINNLQREKEDITLVEERIQELEKKSHDSSDIIIKSQFEDEAEKLRRKKDAWSDNKPMFDYLFETGELLYKYYDLQDKIQNGNNSSSKVFKAKPGSVLAALQEGSDEKAPVTKKK